MNNQDFQQKALPLDIDPEETMEWKASLSAVVQTHGKDRALFLLEVLNQHACRLEVPVLQNITPYINTISFKDQPTYPGDLAIEFRILQALRWNAMAMVVRANKVHSGIGGHLSTYASVATLFEVGFNHVFRGHQDGYEGDQIFFQGHASPGIYARAFLMGRLSSQMLLNFRQELAKEGGLSSYPHPWLMPDFWEFPTVSMGLGPLSAIYQARFNRYLLQRGLKDTASQRVWAFLGDGEMDEPESLGAITVAGRECLSNLTFVINCNLQRLDGPVRGNSKIVQELEPFFKGAGWNVIKVMWASEWDDIFAQDTAGVLVERLTALVDGEFQKMAGLDGAYIRDRLFGGTPDLRHLVAHLSDEQLLSLRRGGHDPVKVYAAYKQAIQCKDKPTVILAHSIKGYGLGASTQAKNVTHQQKKLAENEVVQFKNQLQIPISDEQAQAFHFYQFPKDSEEYRYLQEKRQTLGGFLPGRSRKPASLAMPSLKELHEFYEGSSGREVSTTMVFVRILSRLLADKQIGSYVVPIVPDEARTFGMESFFGQYGIYAPFGQKYEPIDRKNLLYYKESANGQILQEGINEGGAMASFIAAATAYATHGVPTIPFYIYYSMFGFQRIGDLAWAAADNRAKGFLLGATAGRTTLLGEGLQHQDGHSHLLALTIPTCQAYDPAFAYEVALIVQDGLKRMYQDNESVFYYITLYNENYEMPVMPADAEGGVIKGLYLFKEQKVKKSKMHVNLLGSGTILREVLKAQDILATRYHVSSDVFSATSYKRLYDDALETSRYNLLHPTQKPKLCHLDSILGNSASAVVAASDYMRAYPQIIAPYLRQQMYTLGTDGFGRSDTREALRQFFEVDAHAIVIASLHALMQEGSCTSTLVHQAIKDLGIETEQVAPWKR